MTTFFFLFIIAVGVISAHEALKRLGKDEYGQRRRPLHDAVMLLISLYMAGHSTLLLVQHWISG